MAGILKAHGARNDIFVANITPAAFPSGQALTGFVTAVCDRSGPLGGDGVYFYDASARTPQAWFFNPDGSSAEFCGNGMRCLGRVLLDERETGAVTIRSGASEYTVRRGETTKEGVRQIRLEHPPVTFGDVEHKIPDLDPALTFTEVAVPNPHLITITDHYDERELVRMGETVPALYPAGANLSVLIPVTEAEIFVRTYERGAGLTASCGSGMVASRAAYSRVAGIAPDTPVIIHNAGGMATTWLNDSRPVLEGNATYVYRAELDPLAPLPPAVTAEHFTDESRAYSDFEQQNDRWLRALLL
jgi:diaminopimelate epimerase